MKKLFTFVMASVFILLAGRTASPNGDIPMQTDTITADTTYIQNRADDSKIKIVKRTINTRQFVGLAVGMMVFIALILTTTQAWNPGGRTP